MNFNTQKFTTGIIIGLFIGGVIMAFSFFALKTNTIKSIRNAVDSTAVKKDLAAPVFKSAKVAATLDNCKLYEMRTETLPCGGAAAVYVMVCVDDQGKVISTAITK